MEKENNKTKIVHFIHGLSMGGAETLVKDYALLINKELFDVTIVCMEHSEGPYEELLRDNGINILFVSDILTKFNAKGIIGKIQRHFLSYFVVKKMLRSEAADVLHSHLLLNQYVKFANLPQNVRIYHTVHNEPSNLWSENNKSRQKDFQAVQWLVNNKGMTLIALHEVMKDELNSLFRVSNTIVLNNGIDFRRFTEISESKAEIRKKNGIPENAFVIGHVGRFSQQKNHNFLIQVFKEVLIQRPNAFLLLVGDGDLKQNIIQQIKGENLEENVLILSNRYDIPQLMKCMDVFAFPSEYEGLGIVAIEAQVVGLPCVLSDRVPDAAVNSISANRIPIDCSDSISVWAKRIVDGPIKNDTFGDLSEWDMNCIIRRLEEIYLGDN